MVERKLIERCEIQVMGPVEKSRAVLVGTLGTNGAERTDEAKCVYTQRFRTASERNTHLNIGSSLWGINRQSQH